MYVSLFIVVVSMVACKRKDLIRGAAGSHSDVSAASDKGEVLPADEDPGESSETEDTDLGKKIIQLKNLVAQASSRPYLAGILSQEHESARLIGEFIKDWEALSVEEFSVLIRSPEFDELVRDVDPDFYQRVLSNTSTTGQQCGGSGLSGGGEGEAEKESQEASDGPEGSKGTPKNEKEEAIPDAGNISEDEGREFSLSDKFLGLSLGLSTLAAVQKYYNFHNNVGVIDKLNQGEVRRMKYINGASLGSSLIFMAMSTVLLAQGEGHQTPELVVIFSVLVAVDALFNFVEARNYIVEGRGLLSGRTRGVLATVSEEGRLRVEKTNLGYADEMGKLIDHVKALPDRLSGYLKKVVGSPNQVLSPVSKGERIERHSTLLNNYYEKLSALSLEDESLVKFRSELGDLLAKKSQLKQSLESPETGWFRKRKMRHSLDELGVEINKIRSSGIEVMLRSEKAREHLKELILEARKAKISLNLPDSMKKFLNPDVEFKESEFDAVFRDAALKKESMHVPELRDSPGGKSFSQSLGTVRGATGVMLLGGGIGLLVFSVIGLREVRDNITPGLRLTEKNHQDEQKIFHDFVTMIRDVFSQKWAETCS